MNNDFDDLDLDDFMVPGPIQDINIEDYQLLINRLDYEPAEEDELPSKYAGLSSEEILAKLASIIDSSGKPLSTPALLNAMKNFKSKVRYVNQYANFADFFQNFDATAEFTVVVEAYFQSLHSQVYPPGHKKQGFPVYNGNSIRGKLSMMKKLFLFTGRGNIKALLPMIEDNINTQCKTEVVIKAMVFTKTEFCKYKFKSSIRRQAASPLWEAGLSIEQIKSEQY